MSYSDVARDRTRYKLTPAQRELLEAVERKELPPGEIGRKLQTLRDKLLVEQNSLELTPAGRRVLREKEPRFGDAVVARVDRQIKLGGMTYAAIASANEVPTDFVQLRAAVLGMPAKNRRGPRLRAAEGSSATESGE